MTELTTEAAQLLAYLLPGFMAAWLFYGLTSHPKPSQFERVIQALIFTFVIQALVQLTEWTLLLLGTVVAISPWTPTSDIATSLLVAIVGGAALAYFTNNDLFHRRLREFGFTSRTSHPSEWFYAFTQHVTYVILHLRNGRRLYGWPKEWPTDPQHGQFYIQLPSWIDENGKVVDLPQLNGVLIHVQDVEWVEFMQHEEKGK